MKIGYARVSTEEQNLELQIEALNGVKCDEIFSEKVSGKKDVPRPELDKALARLREGDTFVVWKLDRFARSTAKLAKILVDLNKRGIQFQSVTDKIDTSTAAGKFYFHILSAVAELEADLNHDRTTAGLASARKQGRVGGRPKALNAKQMEAAKVLFSASGIAAVLDAFPNLNRRTAYRYLQEEYKR